MAKISFKDFEKIMLYDISKIPGSCIEIDFDVQGSLKYQGSWLGKMINNDTNKEDYWFGLVPDGSEAYEFTNFGDFTNAKIFDGKSLKEIWSVISIVTIDGVDAHEMLPYRIPSWKPF